VGFYPLSRSDLGPAYARMAEASTSFPVPPEGLDSGRRVSPWLCQAPLGDPIGYSSPHDPQEGSFRVWPSGSLDTRTRGVSHANPLGGCYVVVSGTSTAHAGVGVAPDREIPPHTPHLRARASRDQGRCLSTPTGHGGKPLSVTHSQRAPGGPRRDARTGRGPTGPRAG